MGRRSVPSGLVSYSADEPRVASLLAALVSTPRLGWVKRAAPSGLMGITAGSETSEADLKAALLHDFAARGSAPKAILSMPESAESRRGDLDMGDESGCRPLPRTLSSLADIGAEVPLSPERAATPRSSPWVQASSVQRDAGTLGMGRKQTLSPERTLSHETPPPIRLD